jgi:hypothetical protein
MCGIIGVLNQTVHPPVEETILRQMLEMIRHEVRMDGSKFHWIEMPG